MWRSKKKDVQVVGWCSGVMGVFGGWVGGWMVSWCCVPVFKAYGEMVLSACVWGRWWGSVAYWSPLSLSRPPFHTPPSHSTSTRHAGHSLTGHGGDDGDVLVVLWHLSLSLAAPLLPTLTTHPPGRQAGTLATHSLTHSPDTEAMMGMYLVAYVGSSRVRERPVHCTLPKSWCRACVRACVCVCVGGCVDLGIGMG